MLHRCKKVYFHEHFAIHIEVHNLKVSNIELEFFYRFHFMLFVGDVGGQ